MDRPIESRGLRDEANVGPDPAKARDLIALRQLDDYRVAGGEPDIRGWPVFTSTGREIGLVSDLLVDTSRKEVVMLDIDLRRDDRHTRAPIRAAWIDRATRRVVIDNAEIERALSSLASPTQPAAADPTRGEVTVTSAADDQPAAADADEVVVRRRPVIEEVVVRRREVDPSELSPAERERLRADEERPEAR